jgi:hypothetical protein
MTKGIYYAAYPWTDPRFFELFDEKFYLFRNNGVCGFTGLKHGRVDGGVSAGNAALEFAILLGCKTIILSGIDLCMPEGKTHVDGTQVEFDINKSKPSWTKIKTNGGTEEDTIPVWTRCLNEYTQSIDKHQQKGKKFTVYNTAERGAVIPLTKYVPMKDVPIKKGKHDIKGIFAKYQSRFSEKDLASFKEIVQNAITRLTEMKKEVQIADSLADDSRSVAEMETTKIWNIISKEQDLSAYGKINQLRANQANLDKLWVETQRAYELNYRAKMYADKLFNTLILDVLQLDTFVYENQISALVNQTDYADLRAYEYYKITRGFTEKVLYYIDAFLDLFKAAEF